MAAGEYISVASQRDTQQATIRREQRRLAGNEHGARDLAALIEAQGIDSSLAQRAAAQLTKSDALSAHARLEFGIDPKALATPWQAGLASMLAFSAGGLIPLLAVLLTPHADVLPVTIAAAIAALAMTGAISAYLGGAPKLKASIRTVVGGIVAMAISYGVGALVGSRI